MIHQMRLSVVVVAVALGTFPTKVPRIFRIFVVNFLPNFAPNFHNFVGSFRASFPRTRRPVKFTKDPRPFLMHSFQANTKKHTHKKPLESRQSKDPEGIESDFVITRLHLNPDHPVTTPYSA